MFNLSFTSEGLLPSVPQVTAHFLRGSDASALRCRLGGNKCIHSVRKKEMHTSARAEIKPARPSASPFAASFVMRMENGAKRNHSDNWQDFLI